MNSEFVSNLANFVPSVFTLIGVVVVLAIANFLFRRDAHGEISVSRQIFLLLLTVTGVLFVIFSLPLTESGRGQILSLLGIVITAVIALSSTTFVANIMAGLMLRAVNSFRPGDFIRSENFFGRVTERGLFHTEIQTEDRDLMTLPNMYLVNNPVTVVHGSGTIISANLSLGYDVSHIKIEEILKLAATETGLDDAFVLVGDLGDFSVSYRVGGFSPDTTRLLSIKSSLRKNILRLMHDSGIEIVSPSFMNQRVLAPETKIIPTLSVVKEKDEVESSAEDVIFDKAVTAAAEEDLKQELVTANERLAELKDLIKSLKDEDKPSLESERERLIHRVEEISNLIADGKVD